MKRVEVILYPSGLENNIEDIFFTVEKTLEVMSTTRQDSVHACFCYCEDDEIQKAEELCVKYIDKSFKEDVDDITKMVKGLKLRDHYIQYPQFFSDEELLQDVTTDRIDAIHIEMGEDLFEEYVSSMKINEYVWSGFLMNKYPERSKDILEEMNGKFSNMFTSDTEHYFEYGGDFNDFHRDFCEFVNLTEATKKRVNHILLNLEYSFGLKK